jgi:hypothetical protein
MMAALLAVAALSAAPAAALTLGEAARALLRDVGGPKPVGDVLFREDFESGTLNAWKPDPGWSVVDRPDAPGKCAQVVASDTPDDIQDLVLAKRIPIVPGHPIAVSFKARYVKGATPMFLRVDFFDDTGKQGDPYARQENATESDQWTETVLMVSDWFPAYARAITIWFHQPPKSDTTALLRDIRVVDLQQAAVRKVVDQLPEFEAGMRRLRDEAGRLPRSAVNDPWAAMIKAWVKGVEGDWPRLSKLDPASHELELALATQEAYLGRFSDAVAGLRAKTLTTTGMLVYRTKPITGTMILPHTQNLPGKLATGAEIAACRGEYEPASIVLWSPGAVKDLSLAASDLRGPAGVIPAANLDVRWVKCWYQAGNAWIGVGQDRTHKVLVPELLLKDDALVKVDYEAQHTTLKLSFPDGPKYVPIDDMTPVQWGTGPKLADFPVRDAATLQPTDLPAGENKQVWITVKVPADAKPGRYTGEIKLAAGGKALGAIGLAVQVLPFDLVPQKTHYDPNLDFTYSLYYWGEMDATGEGTISLRKKNEQQFRGELQAMWDHGIVAPCMILGPEIIYDNEPLFRRHLQAMKDIGMSGRPLYLGDSSVIGAPSDKAGLDTLRAHITKALAIAKDCGFTEVYFYGIDEATGDTLKSERVAWPVVQEAGGKVIVSGFRGQFEAVGDMLDLFNFAGPPDPALPKLWHGVGHKLWNYANPQTPPENPELYRRNYGLFLWKIDWDGENTYCFMDSAWNDFADNSYRAHNLGYPTVDGCVTGLALEGLREAADDVKYVCVLRAEIEKTKTGSAKAQDAATKAQAWIDGLEPRTVDLDDARAEMIKHILAIRTAK